MASLIVSNVPVNRLRSIQFCWVWLICSGMVLFSCAKREVVRQPEMEPYTGPVTIEVLKQAVGFRDIQTIKALTDVTIYKNGEAAESFSGAFGYQAPDYLKTSFFGPLGITVMEFLITKDILQISLPSQNTLYEMRSPEISFASLMSDKYHYVMKEEEGFYLLLAYDRADMTAGPVMKYLFDRTYLLNRRIVVYKRGGQEIRIDFYDFNGKVPERTRLSFTNFEIEIALQEPEYNTGISLEYFGQIDHTDKKIVPFQDLLKKFNPGQ